MGCLMPLLELEHVSRHFGGLVAVSDVSFEVHEGELVGLIGPNGAGKTTLFNLIAGAVRPTAGRIRLQGRDITGLPAHEVCKLGIARTFQITKPFTNVTVSQNVMVGALNRATTTEARMMIVPRVLDELGLTSFAERPARTLTVAMRKRLELARALATGPKLLLLDEVLAGLTPTEIEAMYPVIRGIASRGITVIMVEHVLHAVFSLCQRVIVLSQGMVIAQGTPQEVARDPAVIASYLGDELLNVGA